MWFRRKHKTTPGSGAVAAVPGATLRDENELISAAPFEIKKNLVIIGRDPRADITIPKDTVSALHASIKFENNIFYLEDLGSSNFTRLNNEKILPNKPVALKSGDLITFDIYKFRFQIPSMMPAGGTMLKKDEGQAPLFSRLKVQRPVVVTCQCGKDLTQQANSDGRLKELAGNVSYSCKDCLPPADEKKVKKIDDYETIRKLGDGAMGNVYLAYHPGTARIVAIKELKIYDRKLAARFYRERQLMKKLNHANVLTYIAEGQDRKTYQPYLVMSYAAEGNLDLLVKKNRGFLPPAEAVDYIIGALAGLEYIHNNGIVHRDLKPENIFLVRSDKGELIPKIADFGISRQFSDAGGTVLTRVGSSLGTILYMAPEQIKDPHTAREPADLYSLGVTLYYLLTGKYTFNFPSPLDIEQFILQNDRGITAPEAAIQFLMQAERLQNPQLIVLNDEPVPVSTRNPHIPKELAEIVDKAVNKDISQRFQTAGEFSLCLRRPGGFFDPWHG